MKKLLLNLVYKIKQLFKNFKEYILNKYGEKVILNMKKDSSDIQEKEEIEFIGDVKPIDITDNKVDFIKEVVKEVVKKPPVVIPPIIIDKNKDDTLNSSNAIYIEDNKDIYKKGLIHNGWTRIDWINNPKTLRLEWFLDCPFGLSGEPDKEKDLDHTEALLELFKNINHGVTVYIPNGVFYTTEELSCAGKHYVTFKGEGFALQQNSYYASNSRLQYRGKKKNATFIDAGKHPTFNNIAIWGNGCKKKWGGNHLQNDNGTIALKIEGSLNARNLQLKYHRVSMYFWRDSYYTRLDTPEIKYTDLAFTYGQVPYNQKIFGGIFQETAKLWDKSGRGFAFVGCSFEHYTEQNVIYPATRVLFDNCYFETAHEVGTFLRLEKRASLKIVNCMVYTKNTEYFLDNGHGYYSVFLSENNSIVNDQDKVSCYVRLSPDNKGQVVKMFADMVEFDHLDSSNYIDTKPKIKDYDISYPKGDKITDRNGKELN